MKSSRQSKLTTPAIQREATRENTYFKREGIRKKTWVISGWLKTNRIDHQFIRDVWQTECMPDAWNEMVLIQNARTNIYL